MKSTLLFLIIINLTLCATAQTDKMIESIRNHYNYVESNLSRFKQTKDMTFEESTDGASIKRYFEGDELVKIRIEYLGETGKLFREFYINEQQLLFVFEQEFNYNMPYYIDSKKAKEMGFEEGFDPKKTKKLEHRYYFFNSKLIRWIKPDGEHLTQKNPDWKEKQNYYLKQLTKFK